jgi:hypothetical protein
VKIPESELNFEIGSFDASLGTRSGGARVKRLATMHYKSPVVRYLRGFLWFLPIMLGLYEEQQELTINFGGHRLTTSAILTIEIYPETLQIYTGELRIQTKLNFVRYCMHAYFWTSMFFFTINLMTLELAILTYYIYKKYYWKA